MCMSDELHHEHETTRRQKIIHLTNFKRAKA